MRYELAVFDLDGTLADSFPFFVSVQNTLARRHGFAEIHPDDVERLRALSPRELMRHVGLPRWKLPFVARGFMQLMRERAEPVPLFDGIADAMVRLHAQGVTLAVVTSNAVDNARGALGEPHFSRLRHVECGASMFGKARRLRRVLKATGIPADRAECHAGGAVAWGYASREGLARCEPSEWFETPAELVRIAGASTAA